MFKDIFKGALTVPNLITLVRIALIPLFAVLYYDGHLVWALVVLAISGLTDTFDGKIARRYNQVSALGKLLDPIADKLTQITIAVMLYLEFRACDSESMRTFSWVFLLFLAKELLMLVVALVMLLVDIRPNPAEIYGKVATVVFYVVMCVIILAGPEIGLLSQFWGVAMPEWLTMALVVLCAVLTFIALFSYIPETIRQFRDRFRKQKEKPQK